MRATLQGKLEERLAFMSIILPDNLKINRPKAQISLQNNANVLTTPFDIHTTLLDAMGLYSRASDYVVPNAKIKRGLSLLMPVSGFVIVFLNRFTVVIRIREVQVLDIRNLVLLFFN